MEDKPVRVGVAVILFNKDNYILLGKRKGSHGAGTWSLPGGRMEYNEKPHVTASREVKEETGISIGVPAIWEVHPFNSCIIEGQHWVTLLFSRSLTALHKQEPIVMEPDKCEEWKWFDRFLLPSPLFPPFKDLAYASGWKIR